MALMGIVDVRVVPKITDESFLLTDCGGSPFTSLSFITSGPVTLRRRNRTARVDLTLEEGGECIDQSITVGRNVARRLNLRDDGRYRVEFDTRTRVLRLFRKPVTTAELRLSVGNRIVENPDSPEDRTVVTILDNQIYVSPAGAIALGIIGERLLVKHGFRDKVLRIRYGSDIFLDSFIQVTPKTAEQLGFTVGNTSMTFNQLTSVLRINSGK